MNTSKMIEVRDRMTCIPAFVFKASSDDSLSEAFFRKAGFSRDTDLVYVVKLETGDCKYDAYKWGDRTMFEAHKYIQDHFDELENGQVVDVRFIKGESKQPCENEIIPL